METIQIIRPFVATTFYVRSNHGFLLVDFNTGEVIDVELNEYGEEYKKLGEPHAIHTIRKFDLDEHLRTGRRLDSGMSYDIVDFGCWYANGEFIGPDTYWRRFRAEEHGSDFSSARLHDPEY